MSQRKSVRATITCVQKTSSKLFAVYLHEPRDFIMKGFARLHRWLTSLIPRLKPKKRPNRNPFDYDHLPRIRPNRLPITRPSSPDGRSSQSLLLEVLPLEIRQQIWGDVLGGHNIHLEIVGDRLGGAHCLSDGRVTCKIGSYGCHIHMEAAKLKNRRHVLPNEEGKLLNLLKTCRQM